jgi:hypothetical protein
MLKWSETHGIFTLIYSCSYNNLLPDSRCVILQVCWAERWGQMVYVEEEPHSDFSLVTM